MIRIQFRIGTPVSGRRDPIAVVNGYVLFADLIRSVDSSKSTNEGLREMHAWLVRCQCSRVVALVEVCVDPDTRVHRVLVIDDDVQLLRALRRRKCRDTQLFTAVDEVSALSVVERERIDVAIVDLRLGKAWGVDLIGTLRAARPELYVAIASASLRPDDVLVAMRGGANDVVPKPFEIPNVLARVLTGPDTRREPPVAETLGAVEAAHVARVFAEAAGNISLTARRLGITRQRLVRKLEQLRPTD